MPGAESSLVARRSDQLTHFALICDNGWGEVHVWMDEKWGKKRYGTQWPGTEQLFCPVMAVPAMIAKLNQFVNFAPAW